MKDTILVADDDTSLRQVLSVLLEAEGFNVIQAVDGDDCLRRVREQRPDLILLDIVMPGKDGREVCRCLREISDVPIIMLTCLPGAKEKVERLNDGADDYVTKPFYNAELIARIKTILRRTRRHSDLSLHLYDDGHLRVDLDARTVHIAGAPVALSPIEWRLLEYFLHHTNRVISHQTLLRYVWGEGVGQGSAYLKVYISHLRRKLGDDAWHPRYIHTEREAGYRFETHV